MNERIKQLVKQSQPKIDWEARHYGELNNGEKLDYQNQWFEKFAELIVKECAESLWTEECYTSDLALKEFEKNSKKIKLHFGVEE